MRGPTMKIVYYKKTKHAINHVKFNNIVSFGIVIKVDLEPENKGFQTLTLDYDQLDFDDYFLKKFMNLYL